MTVQTAQWILQHHVALDYVIIASSLIVSLGLLRSYGQLLRSSGQQELHLLRLGAAFVCIGAGVVPHLFFVEFSLSRASAGVLGDVLELWGGILICFALVRSVRLFVWLAGWALAVELLIVAGFLFVPSGWEAIPWPFGGGFYPLQAAEKLFGELPLYFVATLLYVVSTFKERELAKNLVTLGMLSLTLAKMMEGLLGGVAAPSLGVLISGTHLIKAVASLSFLCSFWVLLRQTRRRQSGNNQAV